MIRVSTKVWVTALLGAFVLIIFFQTLALSPVARLVPMVVLIPTLALFISQLILDLRGEKAGSPDNKLGPPGEAGASDALSVASHSSFNLIGWLCALLVGLHFFGLFFSLPLFVLLYLKMRAKEGWPLVLTMALLVLALEYGLFALLDTPMYEGWFWNLVRPTHG